MKVFVSASSRGVLLMNKGACAILQAHHVTHICLLVDRATGRFALQPVDETAPDAFRLRYRAAQCGLNVPHFWSALGITVRSGGQRFPVAWNDQAGQLEGVYTPQEKDA